MKRRHSKWNRKTTIAHGFVGVPASRFNRRVQDDDYSCGANSVWMAANHVLSKQCPPFAEILKLTKTKKGHGAGGESMADALRGLGLQVYGPEDISFKELRDCLKAEELVIALVDEEDHWLVVHGIDSESVHVADPSEAACPRRQTHEAFKERSDCWGIRIVVCAHEQCVPWMSFCPDCGAERDWSHYAKASRTCKPVDNADDSCESTISSEWGFCAYCGEEQ